MEKQSGQFSTFQREPSFLNKRSKKNILQILENENNGEKDSATQVCLKKL